MGVISWIKKKLGGAGGGFVEGHVFNAMGDGVGGEIASRAAGAATNKGVNVAGDAAENKVKANKAAKAAGGAAPAAGGVEPPVSATDFSQMNVIARSGEAAFVQDEDGDRMWVQGFRLRWNGSTSADEWPDDWGPLHAHNQDLNEFAYHQQSIENENGGGQDQNHLPGICQRLGYTDVGQWFRVRQTFLKYYGAGDKSDIDGLYFESSNEFNAAMIAAAGRANQDRMAATAAANPQLLEPVEGVTVEVYAQCAAQAAQGLGQAEFQALLGQYGMDQAKWDRVQAGWGQKMQNDTTATIATIYGKAFQQQGAGQFGAAGAAAGNASSAMGSYGGGQVAGEEPVPFEKLCEIQGAQTAWSETGQDVNAMLQQVFSMNALDWSNMSGWWMQKMMADPAMFEKYNQWCEHYKAQYLAQAGHNANPDADISF